MANRDWVSQFYLSLERQPVHLMGSFTQVGAAGAHASLVNGGLTYTAVAFGTSGNAITIALINPGVDGALSISVIGNAISVTLAYATGAVTTTYNALKTALLANSSVTALISIAGASGSLVTALAPTALAGGAVSSFSSVVAPNTMSLTQTDTGLFTISLTDPYSKLLSCNIMLSAASAVDLAPQLIAVDTLTAKTITFRLIAVGSGAPVLTNMAAGNALYIDLCLRNSSN